MKFAFTDEQRMLRDTSQAFLADTSSSRAVRMACASDRGFDDALWRRVCDDMYWQGILVPEAGGQGGWAGRGGGGGDAGELLVILIRARVSSCDVPASKPTPHAPSPPP